MLPPNPPSERVPRLADRLAAARRGRFVGRLAELALFRSALVADELPFAVLHLHGPGGVGKTTLLREYARIAAECGRPGVYLDGRDVEPSPAGFLRALGPAVGLAGAGPPATGADWPRAGVLLIDTYEALAPLDPWLRETFLPGLPAGRGVVGAGRNPPAPAGPTPRDWADLPRVAPLANLRREKRRASRAARAVPKARTAALLAFTRGHPLALALVADAPGHGDELVSFDPRGAPEVVRVLLERLVRDMPSAAHRLALELCALAWTTTEDLLAAALGVADAHGLFAWLRGLSFIEQGAGGLFPHDLAREVLDSDLRWRNPAEYGRLRERVFAHLQARAARAGGADLQQIRLELLYLSRHDPFMQPYFDWGALDSADATPATPADAPAILAMVRAHEGDDAARIAAHWLGRQPGAFLAFRGSDGTMLGFMANLALREATPEDLAADPAVAAALDFARRHGPPRPGEEIVYLRFWMARETYQRVGPALNLTAINSVICWTTHPRLAWNFIAVADPDFMQPHFTSIHMWRSPEADFAVGGRRYGVFTHDWRVESAAAWQERAPHHFLAPAPAAGPGAAEAAPPPAPSRAEFAEAVRQALRDYRRPDRLAANPLLRPGGLGGAAGAATPAALQALLREAAASLTANPKDIKFHRAIWHTYFEPAPTQERAAELLGLPFNTYRYHLAGGIGQITDWLWQRESADPDR